MSTARRVFIGFSVGAVAGAIGGGLTALIMEMILR